MPLVWIITGKQNAGKSVLMMDIIAEVKQRGYPLCGLVSPGVYQDDLRIAIQVLDVGSGERTILAELKPGWDPGNPTKKWKMNEEAVQWGAARLGSMDPAGKVFFLDEIGIYEILEKTGWQKGLEILQEKTYYRAFISVRKEVVPEIIKICENADIFFEEIDLDAIQTKRRAIVQKMVRDL